MRSFHQFKVMAETHIRHVTTTICRHILFHDGTSSLVIMSNVFIKNGNFVLSPRFTKARQLRASDFLFS